MSSYITVATPEGDFRAYLALPANLPAPAIVVVQEIFGVNADIRQTCDELAAQGYLAISPDLFWRMEPALDLSDRTEAEWKKALVFYSAFDYQAGVADIAKTLEHARSLPGQANRATTPGSRSRVGHRNQESRHEPAASSLP